MRQNYQIYEQFPSHEEEEALNFPVFLLKGYVDLMNDTSICPLLIRDAHGGFCGFWLFKEMSDCWFSPLSAPFSSPMLANELKFADLLKLSVSFLKKKSNKPVRFVINPLFTSFDTFQYSDIISIDLNHFMEIDEPTFMKKLPQKRRRQKLRVLRKNEYVVNQVEITEWEQFYLQNLKWRIEKGHQNFISLKKMIQFKIAFPKRYLGFQLTYAEQLIGSAIVVRVSKEYLYLYSLIIDPHHDREEPSLLLYEALYDYAKSNNFKILDLGTSMNFDGTIHKNIAHYKTGIGASSVRKYTFEC